AGALDVEAVEVDLGHRVLVAAQAVLAFGAARGHGRAGGIGVGGAAGGFLGVQRFQVAQEGVGIAGDTDGLAVRDHVDQVEGAVQVHAVAEGGPVAAGGAVAGHRRRPGQGQAEHQDAECVLAHDDFLRNTSTASRARMPASTKAITHSTSEPPPPPPASLNSLALTTTGAKSGLVSSPTQTSRRYSVPGSGAVTLIWNSPSVRKA